MSAIVLKRTGQKMPLVGFGLWKTVYEAIKAGYRLLDGAGDYGNEKEAGDGVRRAIKDGLVKREELFHFPIALQYVDPGHRYPPEWFDDNGHVQLRKKFLHIYFDSDEPASQKTRQCRKRGAQWKNLSMKKVIDGNFIISNCSGSLIVDVLRYARIQPQVLQVEIHPYLVQTALVDLAKTLGIAVTAYSSFGPQGYVELSMDKGAASLLGLNTVTEIAIKHEKSPAQVLLRWATQRGIAVVPKSNSVARIIENLQCDSFDLAQNEIDDITALNKDLRLNNPAEIDPRLAIFA
ncbi:hypothetical protein DXG01_009925 [Tephrocybe rancida]|nr:hypothetical protein DXG01_009925 [Tephrocybe rancida]